MAGTSSPPRASQRSCARPTASAVRDRTTADHAVATSRPSSTGSRTSAATVIAGTTSGAHVPSACGAVSYGGGNGAGSRATNSMNMTATAGSPIATHRQRGPGNRPSGKNSTSSATGTYHHIHAPCSSATSTVESGRPGTRPAAAE